MSDTPPDTAPVDPSTPVDVADPIAAPALPPSLEPGPPVELAETAELNAAADEAARLGYIGTKVDPTPDDAWSIASGPTSPSTVATSATRSPQHSIDDVPSS